MPSKPRNFNPQFCYHIYNSCVVEKRKIFPTDKNYQRFLNTIEYYLYNQSISYAQFQDLPQRAKEQSLYLNPKGLEERRVKLLAYCLMPNHFHLLLRPKNPSDISRFISDITNSYTRYFNTKNRRSGVLFRGTFKSKEIADDASLLQVSRYIHLNPIISSKANPRGTLKKPQDYPYSSYHEWAGFKNPHLVEEEEINSWVKQAGGPKGYRDFVESRLETNPALGIEDLVLESFP